MMKCENNLNLVNYTAIVEAIADGYFDFDGTYQPHIGLMNAMRLFYNNCVVVSAFDEKHPHNISNILDMQEIVDDEEFISEFNNALCGSKYTFDFANAFAAALSIVEVKRSSIGSLINYAKNVLIELSNTLSSVMTQENMDALKAVAGAIGSGEALDEALAQARIKRATEK